MMTAVRIRSSGGPYEASLVVVKVRYGSHVVELRTRRSTQRALMNQ